MEEDGILEEITPTSYKYFHNTHFKPLFLVPKPGNVTEEPLTKENVADRYRMVVDSRNANVATAPLEGDWKQYLSSVDDVLRSIPWSKDGRVTNREKPSRFFATVDVKAAYWRMHYDEDSLPLFGAAIQLPDHRTGEMKTRYFLHKALIMGWVHSAAWWSYGLALALRTGLPEYTLNDEAIITYLDDVLIHHHEEAACRWLYNVVIDILEYVRCEVPVRKRQPPSPTVDFLKLKLCPLGWSLSEKTQQELYQVVEHPPTTVPFTEEQLDCFPSIAHSWCN
ncbi:hypothetical protein Pmar_PMAR027053 [Perkinsus marinus ATCC 50983]|uniref:Reverse transcriptase domain-containing protein n=1 Tax=Perkinsus marinus (strain ATCC 50983 / TXsc) TaxID=423536 RepID=C5KW44_PERM5|nr:hypothetical protein Pmar_PMAR027053 [Perkinsus marinus ATCC 50983]EER11298.1 hypothetical protein Pmar_PMAR027053 [Perkinsus marinus ATCC 50983]|eukprot:XP_002779503.1 hypothetical protein Pmar_PMAR027053 [Perkinsus marinus ATCC 50983]